MFIYENWCCPDFNIFTHVSRFAHQSESCDKTHDWNILKMIKHAHLWLANTTHSGALVFSARLLVTSARSATQRVYTTVFSKCFALLGLSLTEQNRCSVSSLCKELSVFAARPLWQCSRKAEFKRNTFEERRLIEIQGKYIARGGEVAVYFYPGLGSMVNFDTVNFSCVENGWYLLAKRDKKTSLVSGSCFFLVTLAF